MADRISEHGKSLVGNSQGSPSFNLAAAGVLCEGITGQELVPHGTVHTAPDHQEEDFMEFDLEDVEEQGQGKALAMACFFSGKRFNARGMFEEMRVAWGLQSLNPVQVPGDNRFLIEFESPYVKQRVVEGGPWRHKWDALIVVSYDGFAPPSSIVISTIDVWARFYDLPAALRKIDYIQKLDAWLGEVQRVDLSYPNYARVRVLFSLANPSVPEAKVRIKGRGDMTVPIHYENVPFFYFICGRLRHSEKECLDGELGEGALNFGAELRASPPKRLHDIRVQTKLGAVHFLNFEGPQRVRLQAEANSTVRGTNSRGSENQRHS
jgi:hypothetical protein